MATKQSTIGFPHILQLNNENFEVAQQQFPFLLINFCDLNSNECKVEFRPLFKKVAWEASKLGLNITFAEVNTQEEPALTHQQQANLPINLQLYIKEQNKFYNYLYIHTSENILKWLTRMVVNISKEIKEFNEFRQYIENNVRVLLYCGVAASDIELTILKKLAYQYPAIHFIHSFEKRLHNGYFCQPRKIMAYNKFDSIATSQLNMESATEQAIHKFIKDNFFLEALMSHQVSEKQYFTKFTSKLLLNLGQQYNIKIEELFRKIAKKYNKDYIFIIMKFPKANNKDNKQQAKKQTRQQVKEEEQQIQEEIQIQIENISDDNQETMVMKEEINIQNVELFIYKFHQLLREVVSEDFENEESRFADNTQQELQEGKPKQKTDL